MLIDHDTVHEGSKKLPRPGMWGAVGDILVYRCLACESAMSLARYQVASDGAVSPAVTCPMTKGDNTPCSFNESITLGGYAQHVKAILPF